MTAQLPERFQVAFSLAGEQRPLVRSVADEVARRLGKSNVFFDEWWEHYIAGGGADVKLQDVYSKAAVVVVCVSQAYGDKPWTQTEHDAIRARQMTAWAAGAESDKLGVLPIRVGDGDVDGILFNTIVPDVRERRPRDTADLIIHRLSLVGGLDAAAESEIESLGYRVHRVEPGDTLDRLAGRYLHDPAEWRRIAVSNRLDDPLAILPGQLLAIPREVDDDE